MEIIKCCGNSYVMIVNPGVSSPIVPRPRRISGWKVWNGGNIAQNHVVKPSKPSRRLKRPTASRGPHACIASQSQPYFTSPPRKTLDERRAASLSLDHHHTLAAHPIPPRAPLPEPSRTRGSPVSGCRGHRRAWISSASTPAAAPPSRGRPRPSWR